jgi:hypothetical protein
MNLIINMEDVDDSLIFRDDGRVLAEYDCGETGTSYPSSTTREIKLRERPIEHETEVSFFNLADYLEFKASPEDKW